MLGFHHYLDCGVSAPPPRMNDRTPKGRVNLIERPVKFRKRDFNEVEIGMSSEEVLQECGRCLRATASVQVRPAAGESNMFDFTIDGRIVSVKEGTTILEAARSAVFIFRRCAT